MACALAAASCTGAAVFVAPDTGRCHRHDGRGCGVVRTRRCRRDCPRCHGRGQLFPPSVPRLFCSRLAVSAAMHLCAAPSPASPPRSRTLPPPDVAEYVAAAVVGAVAPTAAATVTATAASFGAAPAAAAVATTAVAAVAAGAAAAVAAAGAAAVAVAAAASFAATAAAVVAAAVAVGGFCRDHCRYRWIGCSQRL